MKKMIWTVICGLGLWPLAKLIGFHFQIRIERRRLNSCPANIIQQQTKFKPNLLKISQRVPPYLNAISIS